MSLRLALASRWTPHRTLVQMLDKVAMSTTAALDSLLERHSPGALDAIRKAEKAPGGDIEARRAAMASAHNARVEALVAALGREKAILSGREALFPVGVMLGREARERLGVGDSFEDLERAARVLYRALGISFTIERQRDGSMLMRVHRCALAEHYSAQACEVLSAGDEGVVRGLDPRRSMRFDKRMTCGHPVCLALITEEER